MYFKGAAYWRTSLTPKNPLLNAKILPKTQSVFCSMLIYTKFLYKQSYTKMNVEMEYERYNANS